KQKMDVCGENSRGAVRATGIQGTLVMESRSSISYRRSDQKLVDPRNMSCNLLTLLHSYDFSGTHSDHPMEGSKFGTEAANNNRRALRDIRNFMGAPSYPRAVSKRGLQGENAVDAKNIPHRPMTRKFAATLKSQACSQEPSSKNERPNKVMPPVPNPPTGMDTSAAIDLEGCQPVNDLPLPMVEEMDVIRSQRRYLNRTARTLIYYIHLMQASSYICPNYMCNQFDINEKMRSILIDWLIEVLALNPPHLIFYTK
ncbi:hypothetical protein Taro_020387, partial [Colocasia esculenta]|nr:hypothetical protein [Colocasia esculenta]